MSVNRTSVTAIMFVLAMTSTFSAYSQSDFMLTSGATMTYDERQQEILQNAKTCAGVEDIRIIQSTNSDVVREWTRTEINTSERMIISRLNKETGLYVAASVPNTFAKFDSKKGGKKEARQMAKSEEFQQGNSEILSKVQTCLATADIRVIETKNADALQLWIKAEDENRNISTYFNAETGVYTAVSSPKTSGEGKVMFRKID